MTKEENIPVYRSRQNVLAANANIDALVLNQKQSNDTIQSNNTIYVEKKHVQRHNTRRVSAYAVETRSHEVWCDQNDKQKQSPNCMHKDRSSHRHFSYTGDMRSSHDTSKAPHAVSETRRDATSPNATRRWAVAEFDVNQLLHSFNKLEESSKTNTQTHLNKSSTLSDLKFIANQNFEIKKESRHSKLINVFSIAQEISKMNVEDLSTQQTPLHGSMTPSSSCYTNSVFEKPLGSSRMSSFSTPISPMQEIKENFNINEKCGKILEKEVPNKALLFRKSIFGIIQKNKELRRQTIDISPIPFIQKFCIKDDIKHESLIKHQKSNVNDRSGLRVSFSANNDFEFNNLSYTHKENQKESICPNKRADCKVSLQEAININNSINSKIENNKILGDVDAKKESMPIFVSDASKSSNYRKYITRKNKNMKIVSWSVSGARKINDENSRPDDNNLSNTNNLNYSKSFLNKSNKSYSYNNIGTVNFDNTNKHTSLEDLSSAKFHYNTLSCIQSKSNDSNVCSAQTLRLDDSINNNSDSNDLSLWLLSVKNKYQNIKLENNTSDLYNSSFDSNVTHSAHQSDHLSQLENNSDIDAFSFSKLGNKSLSKVRQTLASFKKK